MKNMNKKFLVLGIVVAVGGGAAAAYVGSRGKTDEQTQVVPAKTTTETQTLATAATPGSQASATGDFDFDAFAEMTAGKTSNMIFAPTGLKIALAMLDQGASGPGVTELVIFLGWRASRQRKLLQRTAEC